MIAFLYSLKSDELQIIGSRCRVISAKTIITIVSVTTPMTPQEVHILVWNINRSSSGCDLEQYMHGDEF